MCVRLRLPPRIMQPSRPSSDKGNLINPFIVVTKCYYEGLISYYITNHPDNFIQRMLCSRVCTTS